MLPALLTATDCVSHIHLVIGSNPLAGARCTKSLEVGAKPVLIAPEELSSLHYGLANKIEAKQVQWIKREFRDEDLTTLGREEVDQVVDAVFVTRGRKYGQINTHISTLCRRLRIPVNVVDAPNLSTFTILSTHSDGPLQIGVTASGKGCKMASRIRREISRALPANLGVGVEKLGIVRRRIWEEDQVAEIAAAGELDEEEDGEGQTATFNKLITPEDMEAVRTRRMRWLAQICEYWPLARLANLTDADIEAVLSSYPTTLPSATIPNSNASTPATTPHQPLPGPLLPPRRGLIVLAGSGPGHPDLLTTAALKAINAADLILADKLVPEGVLNLIPRRTPVQIARKFPGNADNAQEELLRMGLDALNQGKTVLRLKQGDPYLYGRGAEEFEFFRAHGYGDRIVVIPGVTSALSGPLFAGIPPTHRSVADQVLVLTGTGRKGASTESPEYVPSRTCVFLMALHRLNDVVAALVGDPITLAATVHPAAATRKWPKKTPCAVVERASCPDQRIIRSTLESVCAAVEEEGSRPPGLLVVGTACKVLNKTDQRWVVEEGLGSNINISELGLVGDWKSLQDVEQTGTVLE